MNEDIYIGNNSLLFAKGTKLPTTGSYVFTPHKLELKLNLKVYTKSHTIGTCSSVIKGGLPVGKTLTIEFTMNEDEKITYAAPPKVSKRTL